MTAAQCFLQTCTCLVRKTNKLEDRVEHTSESGEISFLYGQGHGIIMQKRGSGLCYNIMMLLASLWLPLFSSCCHCCSRKGQGAVSLTVCLLINLSFMIGQTQSTEFPHSNHFVGIERTVSELQKLISEINAFYYYHKRRPTQNIKIKKRTVVLKHV